MKELETIPYDSPFGTGYVDWKHTPSGPRIQKVWLPGETRQRTGQNRTSERKRHPGLEALIMCLDSFFQGKPVQFSLELVDWKCCSEFQHRVLSCEFLVPRGRVTSYYHIARHLDMPQAVRAVGRALAANPFPILIPCHRTVRHDCSLGGYRGGIGMKKNFLETEGVRIYNNRVDPSFMWSEF
jgi:methylated-DNA-[protein]-cysteine S-methyltransferase